MTQSTLLSLARLEIPEINSEDVISSANLLIILNLACTEFVDKTDCLPTSGTFDIVLNQVEYSLASNVSAFGKFRKEGLWLYNASTSKWNQLDATTVAFLNKHFSSWLNDAASLPQRYSLDGDTITLHPKASSTYVSSGGLKLFYYKRSVDMSNSSHYPFSGSTTQYSHLANYELALMDYVRYKTKKMLGKNAEAEEAKQMFYTKCADAKQKLAYRPDLIGEVRAHGTGNLLFHQEAYNK